MHPDPRNAPAADDLDPLDEWTTATLNRLLDSAAADLAVGSDVRPMLVVHDGTDEVLTAWLRPFAPGRHEQAILEVVSLAIAFRVQRMALSMAGRAWSLADPLPPVTADVDLRQRVVIATVADGSTGRARLASLLQPFDPVAAGDADRAPVRWGERTVLPGGQGWIASTMATVVTCTPVDVDVRELRRQAVGVRGLGHELLPGPALRRRLGAAARGG